MQQKTRSICNHYKDACRHCPLKKPCKPVEGDGWYSRFNRMNDVAEGVEFKGFE